MAEDKDRLTGLLGKEALETMLTGLLQDSPQSPISLALMDIDMFKALNDKHGREMGDAVLKALARILATVHGVRAARFGGDEFVLLFPGMEREQAFLQLEKVREKVEENEELISVGKPEKIKFTVSIGLAAYPIDGETEAELMRKANGALYRAKLSGRNRVSLALEEKLLPKTTHYTSIQLERLGELAREKGVVEAVLLREALDDLLVKYLHGFSKG